MPMFLLAATLLLLVGAAGLWRHHCRRERLITDLRGLWMGALEREQKLSRQLHPHPYKEPWRLLTAGRPAKPRPPAADGLK